MIQEPYPMPIEFCLIIYVTFRGFRFNNGGPYNIKHFLKFKKHTQLNIYQLGFNAVFGKIIAWKIINEAKFIVAESEGKDDYSFPQKFCHIEQVLWALHNFTKFHKSIL